MVLFRPTVRMQSVAVVRCFTKVDYTQTGQYTEQVSGLWCHKSPAPFDCSGEKCRRQQSVPKGRTANDGDVNKGRVGLEKGDCNCN